MKNLILRSTILIILTTVALALPLFSVSARNIRVSAQVDRQVMTLHDQLVLTISVSGEGQNLPDPGEPDFSGFNLADVSTSNSFSFVNGAVASTLKKTFVLIPLKEGVHIITPVPKAMPGVTNLPAKIKITVKKGIVNNGYSRNQNRSNSGQNSGSGTPPGNSTNINSKNMGNSGVAGNSDFFVETSVSKKRVFVNEQLTLIFKFYRAKPLYRNPDFTEPKAQGFTMELLTKQSSKREVINGKAYQVEIIKYALFPLFSGKHTIQPAMLTLYEKIQDNRQRRSRSAFNDPFFDNFFSNSLGRGRYAKKSLTSNAIQVEVMPLPDEGRPVSEVKSIGSYNLSGLIDKKEVKVNEAIALKVIVSGYGMVKTIKEPDLLLPNSFTKYDSKVSEASPSTRREKVFGSKTFEYVLIPQKEGTFTVGPVKYNFFNPETSKYEVAETEKYTIKVNPGKKQSVIITSGVTKKNIELINDDISFIKLDSTALVNRATKPWKASEFWASLWFSFGFLVLSIIIRLYHDKILSDPVLMRRRAAAGNAEKELSRLETSVETLGAKEFYSGLSKTIINLISDRLDLAGSGLTNDKITDVLKKSSLSQIYIDETQEFLNECDLMAFSAMNHSGEQKRANLKKACKIKDFLSELIMKESEKTIARGKLSLFLISFVLIFLTIVGSPLFAGRAEMFFEQGNQLYKEKKYDDALKAYAKIVVDDKIENEFVYFNMGNCCYRLNQIGRARYFYEKALEIAPNDKDIIKNLNYLKLKLEDKIEPEKRNFIETLTISWTGLFSHSGLSWALLLCLHSFLIMLCFRVFASSKSWRKRILAINIIVIIVVITLLSTLAAKVYIEEGNKQGIVTVERLSVHAEPELSSKIKFSVHQGAKLKIEKARGLWYRVSLPNGFFGWVEKASLDKL